MRLFGMGLLRKLCCLQTHSKVTENYDIIDIAFSLIMLTI